MSKGQLLLLDVYNRSFYYLINIELYIIAQNDLKFLRDYRLVTWDFRQCYNSLYDLIDSFRVGYFVIIITIFDIWPMANTGQDTTDMRGSV